MLGFLHTAHPYWNVLLIQNENTRLYLRSTENLCPFTTLIKANSNGLNNPFALCCYMRSKHLIV